MPTSTIATPARRTALITIQRLRATASLTCRLPRSLSCRSSIEHLPQLRGRCRDRLCARREQLLGRMIAPGDADRPRLRGYGHLDVVDGVADHHRLAGPRTGFGH